MNLDAHYNFTLDKAKGLGGRLLTVFVKGENLLAQNYQTYLGYYMPRATVFGGVRLRL